MCLIKIVRTIKHYTIYTIAVLVCKQISYNLFKNEITNKLFTYKSYMYNY